MRVISILNFKGGTGKSSLAIMTEEQGKKPAKPIGSIGDFSTLGKKRSEVQTSTSPDTEIPGSFDARKSRHPDWKQKTVYLPAELAKWLNVFAATAEMEVSEVVAQALREFREKHK
jgi:hypothetical protein